MSTKVTDDTTNRPEVTSVSKPSSLTQAAEIAQIVATIALIITLIFVGLQIKQSSQQAERANIIAQAQLSTSATQNFQNFFQNAYATKENVQLLEKAVFTMEPLTEYEQTVFIRFMEDLVTMGARNHGLHKQGLVTDATYYGGNATAAGMLTYPRPRKWWARYRNIMSWDDEFVAHMDAIFVETTNMAPANLRDTLDVNTPLPNAAEKILQAQPK